MTVSAVIDTHCHLDLVAGKGIATPDALQTARDNGLEGIVQIATDLESAQFHRSLAEDAPGGSPRLYWTVGLHPESADRFDGAYAAKLRDVVQSNRDNPDLVAIGETGLDYFHTTEHEAKQKESFAFHLDLARREGLPIVLHTRDDRTYTPEKTRSVSDALAMLREHGDGVRGVLHCFTYTEKEALPFVEMGWFVSYSGVLTFKNAEFVQQGASRLPLECLMVETDAPYLAPNPHRGKTNQPAHVVHTLDFLATLRKDTCGEDPEFVRKTVLENSRRFLALRNSH